MNQTGFTKALMAWALGATLVAVSAVSFILGKAVAEAPSIHTPVAQDERSRSDAAPAATRSRYAVPESWRSLPTEWRSRVVDAPDGFAALFDPTQRRLIVERCAHHAYFSREDMNDDLCTPLASGVLQSLGDTRATLRDRAGQQIDVRVAVDDQSEPPVLRLEIRDEHIEMIPGSRHDLYQAFEALPTVRENRTAHIRAMLDEYSAPNDHDAGR